MGGGGGSGDMDGKLDGRTEGVLQWVEDSVLWDMASKCDVFEYGHRYLVPAKEWMGLYINAGKPLCFYLNLYC